MHTLLCSTHCSRHPIHHTPRSNFADQRLYVQRGPGAAPEPLTAEGAQLRVADALVDGPRKRLVAVVEDHSKDGQEAINTIGAVGECVAAGCGKCFFAWLGGVVVGQVERGLGAQLRFADVFVDGSEHPPKQLPCSPLQSTHKLSANVAPCRPTLCADLSTGAVTTLASGRDFYMSPALNSDGTKMAWVEWK